MHELVIVVSDLYLSQEAPERELPAGVTLPGLQHAARFAERSRIVGGWRSWLGHWLTGKEAGAPAAVAAATLQRPPSGPPLLSLSHPPSGARPAIAWMATPVHLVAGLTSVHVDRRSILRLDANDQSAFAADFQRVFHDSGFQLQPLDSGDFLMLGPQMPLTETSEPARSMGASMADAQPADAANPSLRRLGAEIEMWLHDHAVNDARARLGEPPVTGLWLWGGAPIGDVAADVGDHAPGNPSNDAASSGQARGPSPGRALRRAHAANQGSGARETSRGGQLSDMGPPSSDIAFGRDAYLQGLWAAHDAKVFPLPRQLADVFGYPQPRRAVLVIEIGLMLHSNPRWTFLDAVAQIDRSFILPAIEALNRGQCERLVILANDHELTLRARDRLKFWRRTPPGLSGLQ